MRCLHKVFRDVLPMLLARYLLFRVSHTGSKERI